MSTEVLSLPRFDRYVGVDYSGASAPTQSLKGLRVFEACRSTEPVEVQPPPSPRTQLLAAIAVADTFVRSNYTLLKGTAVLGAHAAVSEITAPGSPPLDADDLALLSVLTATFDRIAGNDADAARFREVIVASRGRLRAGHVRRADAALHLAAQVLGQRHPPDLTVAMAWPPAPARDPLHAFFGVHALQRTETETRIAATEPLRALLAERCEDGPGAGSWPAARGLDAATTAAILAAVIGLADSNEK
jgi:hypothetical protein